MHKLGINGRLWLWLKDFLDDRTAQYHIDDIDGDSIRAKLPYNKTP